MRGKPRGYRTERRTKKRIKRPKPNKNVSTLELQQLKIKIKEVNKRIEKIEKKYGSDKWAVKKLKSRLNISEINGLDKNGRVKRISGKDKMKMKAVNKALDLFLSAKTSTIEGIEDTIIKSKKTIKEVLNDEDEDLDDEDVETFYDFYIDNDFKWLVNYIEPSELMVLIQVARGENYTEKKFINELNNYIAYGNDKDITNKLKRLYKNLVIEKRDLF